MPDARDPQAVIAAAEQAALAGDYAAAERLLREAAELQEASLGPSHPELANTLNNLGVVYEVTEKPDEAERCFRRASTVAAAVLAPDHPFVATSRKNLEDFCAARGIPVAEPAPGKTTAAPAIEPVAIEPAPASAGASPPVAAPPALPRKKDFDPPALEVRQPRSEVRQPGSMVVPGLVAAALLVAVLIGRMWFGSSDAPPTAADPAASPPVARPTVAPEPSPVATPEPSPAKTPPATLRKDAPPVKPQAAKPTRPAETGAPKGAPIVVSIQVCADLGTSGAGEWRCTPPRNPAPPGRMYFYTRLKSERETKVQHRWYQGERLRQSVELTVHANPGAGYRTYSRNTVASGDWRVELRTRDGALLREERFTVK